MLVSRPVGVVFVHGFRSSAAIWSRMIQLIATDAELAGFAAHPFEYASPGLSLHPLRRIPSLADAADSLRTWLSGEAAGHPRLVLVTHSQGGLVVQRFLARMLAEGKGTELARIRRIVMFACPNSGSEFALLLRRRAWFWRHPQERELRPLATVVLETQRIVLNQVIHADRVGPDRCPIPIVAYAGDRDGVVTPASAGSVFPDTGVLPGDHFSIIQPRTATDRSFLALKRHLLAARDRPAPARPPVPPAPAPAAGPPDRTTAVVDLLLAVPRIREQQFRDQLYQLLPGTIVDQLRRDSSARLELFALVHSFGHFPRLAPWQALATALTTLAPDQQPVTDLIGYLADAGLITDRPG